MQRVERHIVINNNVFDDLTHKSKNLYNYVNYLIRQNFFETGKMLSEYGIMGELARENQVDYRALPAQTSQQIIKLLFRNWKSFFSANKDYKKTPGKYNGRPRLPGYKDKDGHYVVIFTNQQISIRGHGDGDYIHFPKMSGLSPVKTRVADFNIKQVRIVPQATCFILEVVHEKEPEKLVDDNANYLSIDLGLNNLVTTFNNVGEKPFIINGGVVKSINQYFNKKQALLMSYIGGRGTSKRLRRLTLKRNNKISDYLHKTSRFIVDYCVGHNISKIIIGNNKNWKQKINLGKTANQNFVSIPFDKLIKQIEYKAEEVGISVIRTEESYTSKIDHFALEPMQKQENYLGRRVKRGLFKSSTGIVINADVNGAIGIMRKVVPEIVDTIVGNRGLVGSPFRINPDKDNLIAKES